jgi:alanine racemase
MGFAEEDDFDPIQLVRFLEVAEAGRAEGIELGRLHAASSHALFHRSEAGLDMVRPGLVLYGAYPAGARELDRADLRPAFRLRARVVRVERLAVGDSVSYGRNYVVEKPTWIATLPVGHADGYPRTAVDGCEVLIGSEPYPVIGAVSASHTIVELGEEPRVRVGDEATLIGPDHPAIHPNAISERAGISVYDVLMHLSAALPRARASG